MKFNLLYKISIGLFSAALLALLCAMVLHAIEGDSSDLAVIFGIISSAASFVGIITACLSVKKRNGENENK